MRLLLSSVFTAKNAKVFVFFLITIIISDIVFGSIFIPESLKNFYNILTLHPYYNQGLRANKTGAIRCNSFSPVYFTNSLGMKDARVREVSETTVKRRILFLGDSFTEGAEYPFDSTYCGVLSSMSDTTKVEILNGGIRGASPRLYYLKLDYLLNHQHVNMNDVYCMVGYTNVPDELVYQHFEPALPDKEDNIGAVKRFLMGHSAAYLLGSKALVKYYCFKNRLPDGESYLYWVQNDNTFNKETGYNYGKFKAEWARPEVINSAPAQKAINLAKGSFVKLQNLCNDHHVKLHLIFYPIAFLVHNPGVNFTQMQALSKNHMAIWSDFTVKNNIDMINLFPMFMGQAENDAKANRAAFYIHEEQHWNAKGHKKVADSLYCIINN